MILRKKYPYIRAGTLHSLIIDVWTQRIQTPCLLLITKSIVLVLSQIGSFDKSMQDVNLIMNLIKLRSTRIPRMELMPTALK